MILRDVIPTRLNASGVGVGMISNDNSAVVKRIDQISLITVPTRSGCTCVLGLPAGIIDTSYFAGTGDVAGGDPPVYLLPGDFITLNWAGGPINGQGIATYFYEELVS